MSGGGGVDVGGPGTVFTTGTTTAAPQTLTGTNPPVTATGINNPPSPTPTLTESLSTRPTPVIFAPTGVAQPTFSASGSQASPVNDIGGLPPANGSGNSGNGSGSSDGSSGSGSDGNGNGSGGGDGTTSSGGNPFTSGGTDGKSNMSRVGIIAGTTAGIAFLIIGGLVVALRRRNAQAGANGGRGGGDGFDDATGLRGGTGFDGGDKDLEPAYLVPMPSALPEMKGMGSLTRSFEDSFAAKYPGERTHHQSSPSLSSPPALVRAGPTSPLPPLPPSQVDLLLPMGRVGSDTYNYSPKSSTRDTFASTYSDVVLPPPRTLNRDSANSGTPPTLDYASPDRHISAMTDATFMTEETVDAESFRSGRDSFLSQGTLGHDGSGSSGGIYESPLLKLVNGSGDGDISDHRIVQHNGRPVRDMSLNAQAAHIAAAATFAAHVPSPLVKTSLPTHVSPHGTMTSTHTTHPHHHNRPLPHLTHSPTPETQLQPSPHGHSIFLDSASDEYAFSDTQSNYSRDTTDRDPRGSGSRSRSDSRDASPYRRFESVYSAASAASAGSGSSHQFSVSSSMEEGYLDRHAPSGRSWESDEEDSEENRSDVVLDAAAGGEVEQGVVNHAERVAQAYRGAWRNTLLSEEGTERSFGTLGSEEGVLGAFGGRH
ncbi:hypothetical protein HDV00_000547 [Rhizophlyctis rosea]|nr:hypothetical protein HDV00_000547 [Rhizophlyctis rosea]